MKKILFYGFITVFSICEVIVSALGLIYTIGDYSNGGETIFKVYEGHLCATYINNPRMILPYIIFFSVSLLFSITITSIAIIILCKGSRAWLNEFETLAQTSKRIKLQDKLNKYNKIIEEIKKEL